MTDPRYPNRDALARAIRICRVAAPHQLPLLEGVQAGMIGILCPSRQCPADLDALQGTDPVLVLVPDDDGICTGPRGWTGIERLVQWSAAAFIHAAGGEPEHYQAAVVAAIACRRLVMIECNSERFQAWHNLFADAGRRTFNITTRAGVAHPEPELRPGTAH